jgi:hypothetical protein
MAADISRPQLTTASAAGMGADLRGVTPSFMSESWHERVAAVDRLIVTQAHQAYAGARPVTPAR